MELREIKTDEAVANSGRNPIHSLSGPDSGCSVGRAAPSPSDGGHSSSYATQKEGDKGTIMLNNAYISGLEDWIHKHAVISKRLTARERGIVRSASLCKVYLLPSYSSSGTAIRLVTALKSLQREVQLF